MSADADRLLRQYLSAHKNFLPDRVRRSRRKAHRKALEALGHPDEMGSCNGWAARLWNTHDTLYHVVLALGDLGLSDLSAESNLYEHAAVSRIKQATLEAFPGTFWLRLEVGNRNRRLHAHALTPDLPTCPHVASIVEDFGRLLVYLHKCPVPGDSESARVFLVARQGAQESKSRLPRTVWWRGIKRK
jgi:hypothetical protein